MTSLREVFSAPFNWCDRRCERCPLATDCPVYRKEQQQRWAHEARGRDPDAPEAVLDDMRDSLETALRMAVEIAEAEGVDLDEPIPERPIVLGARRLERDSLALVRCVAEAARTDDEQKRETTAELRSLSTTLATKSARIAAHLERRAEDPDDGSSWAFDAAPNLLLLDRLKKRMAEELAQLSGQIETEPSARALAELERSLDPLIELVGSETRAVLAALEARGAAPSPFIRGPAD